MRHFAVPARATLASAPILLLLVVACGPSEQEKRLRALAGTYAYEYETDPATDPGHMRIHERQALTLKADNTWRLVHTVELNGAPAGGGADSGRFGVSGSTLNVTSEANGLVQYTVSGDTLWARNGRMAAMAAGMGVKLEDRYLVRER
jgi:hypothetical protein